jgi:flagellar hook-associated protein 1 FlgK
VDEFARTLILQVNRIHADGQGLVPFRSVVGAVDLLDADAPLNSTAAGVPFAVTSGSFYVSVMDDATGTPVAYRIDVDLSGTGDDTSLESLAATINDQVEGVTARVTSDNRLAFEAEDGLSFVFGYDGQRARTDTSGVLAALGINTFFSGTDATNIVVNETLVENPSLLAAAAEALPGDGVTAGRIAALDTGTVIQDGYMSIPDVYDAIANAVAVAGNSSNGDLQAAQTVMLSLQAQRESISGVNLDEEAISLVKFERAFQGAARFISAVDEMIGELVAIIQ